MDILQINDQDTREFNDLKAQIRALQEKLEGKKQVIVRTWTSGISAEDRIKRITELQQAQVTLILQEKHAKAELKILLQDLSLQRKTIKESLAMIKYTTNNGLQASAESNILWDDQGKLATVQIRSKDLPVRDYTLKFLDPAWQSTMRSDLMAAGYTEDQVKNYCYDTSRAVKEHVLEIARKA